MRERAVEPRSSRPRIPFRQKEHQGSGGRCRDEGRGWGTASNSHEMALVWREGQAGSNCLGPSGLVLLRQGGSNPDVIQVLSLPVPRCSPGLAPRGQVIGQHPTAHRE